MIAVAAILCGALGAVTRFIVDAAVRPRVIFPLATLFINITGSALLGVLAGLVMFHGAPSAVTTIIGTGFCGGYTTFSTASLETMTLARERRQWRSVAYAVVSVVGSVLACAAGMLLV
ncbi:fluoride efflux transporter CrcB [Gordonia sp. TBRC 11910]|uniref:Fluoride-specific ion channel FluC n=1 Tax=Gordonia asplenii TaxID=2725283 RepID=A0A848L0N2_9ACTN|nr:fluoride efflux transporter CrcB [Gordonia asplenii]NMO04366.1 fluoride efflux transporter CrcB [Gordonia asplenii]